MDTTVLQSVSPLPSNGSCSASASGYHPTEETSGWSKFRLLLWKNWMIQRRNKLQTLFEVALPVFFASLLVIIRDLAPADVYQNATIYPAYTIGQLPVIGPSSFADIPLTTVASKVV